MHWVRINAVAPNEVNTPMLRTGFVKRGFDPDTAVAELGKTVPLGRIAEPEDIANVILFLASDAARYMCGTVVEVNGGKPGRLCRPRLPGAGDRSGRRCCRSVGRPGQHAKVSRLFMLRRLTWPGQLLASACSGWSHIWPGSIS